jgi:hypothetical protein
LKEVRGVFQTSTFSIFCKLWKTVRKKKIFFFSKTINES